MKTVIEMANKTLNRVAPDFAEDEPHWRGAEEELERFAELVRANEPVAKPYAYEYGRDNGDGTYSVVIEKGDLVQTAPAVYNYVRPRNRHKDWPIKELFDSPYSAHGLGYDASGYTCTCIGDK